jgi:hypothetical protein
MSRVELEWDDLKAAANRRKHGVTFEEATTVFDDPLARIFEDEDSPEGERREILIGRSSESNLLLVCFTERGEAVRMISARRATRQERQDYEENIS